MGFIDHFIELIKSPKVKLPWKVTVIITLVLLVLLADNILGFTYSYKLEREVALIKDLDNLAYGDNSDFKTKNYALNRKRELLQRKNYLEKLEGVIDNIKWHNDKKEATKTVTKTKINPLILHLTAGGLFYVFAFFAFIVILWARDEKSFFIDIVTAFVSAILIAFIGYVIYLATLLIPLFEQPWINYILNSIIQVFMIGSLIWVATKEYTPNKRTTYDSSNIDDYLSSNLD